MPGEYSSIQSAIDASHDGDTVVVSSGTYCENILLHGKSIALWAKEGRERTFIVGCEPNDPVVTIEIGYDTTIEKRFEGGDPVYDTIITLIGNGDTASSIDGFSITSSSSGRGIVCQNTSPLIQNCEISYCSFDGDGVGIYCYKSGAKIRNNVIHHNTNTQHFRSGGGIGAVSDGAHRLEIVSNIIYENMNIFGSGIALIDGEGAYVARNLIYKNLREGIYLASQEHCEVVNNTIVDNRVGIVAKDAATCNIRNNIVVSNLQAGITPDGCEFSYNNVWNNGSANDPGTNGISADPRFIDDSLLLFSLGPQSPCIDSGDPDPRFTDADGSRSDIGAISFFHGTMPLPSNLHLSSESYLHVIDHTPVIEWNYIDSVGQQNAYEIEVGLDSNWSNAEVWASGTVLSSEDAVELPPSGLQDGNFYFARLRLNNGISWGTWREIWWRMNTFPSIPQPKFPVNDLAIQPAAATLEAHNSSDQEGDSKTYEFELVKDTISIALWSKSDVEEQSVITRVIPGTDFELDTRYWWRIRCFDGYEYSPWSTWESFWTRGPAIINVPEEWPTIQGAIETAANGDTILVGAGTYVENIKYKEKALVIISSQGNLETVLKPLDPSDRTVLIDNIKSGEEAILRGFTLTGGGFATTLIVYQNTVVTVIEGNVFHSNIPGQVNPHRVVWAASPTILRYNLFYENGGINTIWTESDNVISNNTIVNNQRGIYAPSGNAVIVNNIIMNNNGYAILGEGYSIFDYNDVWGNGSGNDGGINGFSLDPLFRDPDSHDFRLSFGSPCIDAGHPGAEYNDPDASRNDIGAFPYVPN